MARHERDFREGSKPLRLDELVSLLERNGDKRSREAAIACYLSSADGWRDAMKLLGGTFAETEARLRDRKED